LVSFTDSIAIRANNGIESLARYISQLSIDDIYDLSERVYHTWVDSNLGKGFERLELVERLRWRRRRYAAFLGWRRRARRRQR
jgi:hypothetical protein